MGAVLLREVRRQAEPASGTIRRIEQDHDVLERHLAVLLGSGTRRGRARCLMLKVTSFGNAVALTAVNLDRREMRYL